MTGFHPFSPPWLRTPGPALLTAALGLTLAGCRVQTPGPTGDTSDRTAAPADGSPDHEPSGGVGTSEGPAPFAADGAPGPAADASAIDAPAARIDGGSPMPSGSELADRCGKYCDCMANHNKSQCKERTPPDCLNTCLREGQNWNLGCRLDKCRVAMTDYQDQITGDCLAAVGVNACFDRQ